MSFHWVCWLSLIWAVVSLLLLHPNLQLGDWVWLYNYWDCLFLFFSFCWWCSYLRILVTQLLPHCLAWWDTYCTLGEAHAFLLLLLFAYSSTSALAKKCYYGLIHASVEKAVDACEQGLLIKIFSVSHQCLWKWRRIHKINWT